jgi:hypothetical protein
LIQLTHINSKAFSVGKLRFRVSTIREDNQQVSTLGCMVNQDNKASLSPASLTLKLSRILGRNKVKPKRSRGNILGSDSTDTRSLNNPFDLPVPLARFY